MKDNYDHMKSNPSNLFEQLTPTTISGIASLLGFKVPANESVIKGPSLTAMRNTLREIAPFDGDFTVGQAFDKYVNHLQTRFGDNEDDEPSELDPLDEEPEDTPCLESGRDNCDDWGTGEGQFHGRI